MRESLLELLYHKRGPVIRRYLVKSGCLPPDAEDIVQETFCKAVEYMAELSEGQLSAWLFRVAVNHWFDLCRREKKRPQVSIDVAEFTGHLREEFDGESFFLQKEQSETVNEVLHCLSEVHQNLLLMKYDMNLSYEQIGVLLDMNPSTVKTYLYRARKAFQKEWNSREKKILEGQL